jgi:hypothetical protein
VAREAAQNLFKGASCCSSRSLTCWQRA